MRVVLLGPNGQLGRDIVDAHRKGSGSFELVPLTREALDLSMPGVAELVLRRLSFDVLVNCTGYHKTDEAEDNAALAFAVNAHAVQAMARVCAAKRARLIHVSTDYVFGGDTARNHPLREDDPAAPINVYGASKVMGENLARLESDNVVISRVASLFGVAGASGKGGNFVETMLRHGRSREVLRVVNDQTMSPTATADIATIMMRMLTDGCAPGIYHVVNAGSATWFEFAQEIFRRTGIEVAVTPCASREYSLRATRPRYSALDNAKVSAAFGAMPRWQDALDRYLRTKGHVSK